MSDDEDKFSIWSPELAPELQPGAVPLSHDIVILTTWGEQIDTDLNALTVSFDAWIWRERVGSDQYGFNVYAFRTEDEPDEIKFGYSAPELLSICGGMRGNETVH